VAGDEPFYAVTARAVYEKLEAHDDLLRDIQRDLRHRNELDEREHFELHERLQSLEGHTHDELSPPKNGNGKRKEWRWVLAVGVGTFLAALAREFGDGFP
jgi:hypothetical protein